MMQPRATGVVRARSDDTLETPAKVRRAGTASEPRSTQEVTPSPSPVFSPAPRSVDSAARERSPEFQDVAVTEDATLHIPRGKFESIAHLCSEGAFGYVCSAIACSSRRRVVIKQQFTHQDCDAEPAHRELRTLMHTTLAAPHPSIVDILACWFRDDTLYIVEERMDMSLATWIAKQRGLGEHATAVSQRQRIMTAVWAGLAHLHECKIVHRDFKPENIVVDADLGRVKMIDFGSCRRPLLPSETDKGPCPMTDAKYVCTYPYRAPETYTDSTQYTEAVDAWSAGCIAAEMILGWFLFPGHYDLVSGQQQNFESIRQCPAKMREKFPVATCAEINVLMGVLNPDPAQRLSCAGALEITQQGQAEGYGRERTQAVEFIPPHYDGSDLGEVQSQIRLRVAEWRASQGWAVREPRRWSCERL